MRLVHKYTQMKLYTQFTYLILIIILIFSFLQFNSNLYRYESKFFYSNVAHLSIINKFKIVVLVVDLRGDNNNNLKSSDRFYNILEHS